jgi:hypothetical protein
MLMKPKPAKRSLSIIVQYHLFLFILFIVQYHHMSGPGDITGLAGLRR